MSRVSFTYIYFVCTTLCHNTQYYVVCISMHAQWSEILGSQQVIWSLNVRVAFNIHSWSVFKVQF